MSGLVNEERTNMWIIWFMYCPVALNPTNTSCSCHTIEAYNGSRGIGPFNLNLGCTWRRVVSFTLRPLHSRGMIPRRAFSRRLLGLHSRSGIRTLNRAVRSLVVAPTTRLILVLRSGHFRSEHF